MVSFGLWHLLFTVQNKNKKTHERSFLHSEWSSPFLFVQMQVSFFKKKISLAVTSEKDDNLYGVENCSFKYIIQIWRQLLKMSQDWELCHTQYWSFRVQPFITILVHGIYRVWLKQGNVSHFGLHMENASWLWIHLCRHHFRAPRCWLWV